MPWVLHQFEDKLNRVYQGQPLENLEIEGLDSKSQVVNQFFDYMVSLDLAEDSFKKLVIKEIKQQCFPLESDVVSRLAQSCTLLQHIEMSQMSGLEEEARMDLASLFRDIMQNSPPLTHLNFERFSKPEEYNGITGQIIMEAILNSSICSLQHINFNCNKSWFID